MTIASLRRGLSPGLIRSPFAMVLLVTALVSGLLTMHVVISSMGTHATAHLSDTTTATATAEPATATPAPLPEIHATSAHESVADRFSSHVAIAAGLPMSHAALMSAKCPNGCVPVHSMGSMGCVLTLATPVLLFAAAHPVLTPALSTDQLPERGLALATQTLCGLDPPDLNVLSVSRT